jgi:hypothetical protein
MLLSWQRASHHLLFATQKKLLCVLFCTACILRFPIPRLCNNGFVDGMVGNFVRSNAIGTPSKLCRVQNQQHCWLSGVRDQANNMRPARISFP